jgi:hypothetical protein
MRSAGNFSPEWGYLAPAPSFLRTARIVIVAATVGATAGAAVVFSLVDRPAADQSVALRTLAVDTPAPPPTAPAVIRAQEQRPLPPPPSSQVGRPATAESGTTTTIVRPASLAALAESPPAADTATPPPSTFAQKRPVTQLQLSGRNVAPAQPSKPVDHGPLALVRSLGLPPASGVNPPPGEY